MTISKELLSMACAGCSVSIAVIGASPAWAGPAGEFPYGSEMVLRHYDEALEVSSWTPVEVHKIDDGMPMEDSVATLYADVVDFSAADGQDWTTGTNVLEEAQAALTMKRVDDVFRWMGYAKGEWVPLVGIVAEEGEWRVKVEIDYSHGAGRERVRYSVGKTGGAMTPLSASGETWLPLGVGTAGGEQKVNKVLVYGCGAASVVEAKSGCRKASGAISVAKDFGKKYKELVLGLAVTDPWGVDSVVIALKDGEGNCLGTQTNELSSSGTATFGFSGVTPYETYTYELTLLGVRRGADVSRTEEPKEVQICVQKEWFSFSDGEFADASADDRVTVTNGIMSAAAFSPRGQILPTSAASKDAQIVTVESRLTVAGAVLEATLTNGLDAAKAQTALTVARFEKDDCRAWACRRADGTWARLGGCSAENGVYDVRVDIDYREGMKVVSYSVKPHCSDEWICLVDEDEQAFIALSSDATIMTKASLLGGTVSSLSAVCKSTPKVVSGMILYLR